MEVSKRSTLTERLEDGYSAAEEALEQMFRNLCRTEEDFRFVKTSWDHGVHGRRFHTSKQAIPTDENILRGVGRQLRTMLGDAMLAVYWRERAKARETALQKSSLSSFRFIEVELQPDLVAIWDARKQKFAMLQLSETQQQPGAFEYAMITTASIPEEIG